MKICLSLLLCAVFLTGCGSATVTEITAETAAPTASAPASAATIPTFHAPDYVSRFSSITEIVLSDNGITVDGGHETDAVFTSNDIIYYEDRDTYDSGNPYGEGTDADKHTSEEAAAHTVVNITTPGAYRICGKLSAGQIRVDLGEDAYADPNAITEIILTDADITCTVAPAILFLNTYECDGNWSADNAQAVVDTTAAGANLILEGENTVSGSYVAKIFKDKDEEKKLWKQDGAIYSYMSMNVFGPGTLTLNATNEGLDTELHLTINGGNITIHADNDGINTNEDGVSVTTINGGDLTIFAGLGSEGDGIDSNGYLMINGGNVVSSANPASDAGLDSDLGSFINGGMVIAFGSAMDWAESDSSQVAMNLQFTQPQAAGSEIKVATDSGTEIFSFTPSGEHLRGFSGLILSAPALTQAETYHVYLDGVQMAYTGSDTMRGPGGFGGRPEGMGGVPGDFDPEKMPGGFDPSQTGGHGQRPEKNGSTPPQGFDPETIPQKPDQMPGSMDHPDIVEGEMPQMPEGSFSSGQSGELSTAFYMNDMVNFFSGVTAAQ